MQALCSVSWEASGWNIPLLEQVLRQQKFPADRGHIPILWQQAKEFIRSNNIDKGKFKKLK